MKMLCSLKFLNRSFISAALAVLVALTVRRYFSSILPADIKQVVDSLTYLESSYRPHPQRHPGPRVLVGFGGCVDLKVRALALFNVAKVNIDHFKDVLNTYNLTGELNSIDDVVRHFLASFSSGAASERVIHNETLFRTLINLASDMVPRSMRHRLLPTIASEMKSVHSQLTSSTTSPPPTAAASSSTSAASAVWALGGNALAMAVRLAREGAQTSLAARLSPRQRTNLPSNVRVLKAPPFGDLPDVPEEDIHLILEYERGENWGPYSAPRANRYILLHDKETALLSSFWPGLLDAWHSDQLGQAKDSGREAGHPATQSPSSGGPGLLPDLFVIGGLQLMDNWVKLSVPDLRVERLAQLGRFLTQLPGETLVHFEMASFVDQAFAARMLREVMPHVDSVGFNEQELPNLANLLSGGPISSISTGYPRAANMLDALRMVWALGNDRSLPRVASPASAGWRRLSRLHLHTLAYQMIMVRRSKAGGAAARQQLERMIASGGLPPRRTDVGLAWPFARAAVAKASLIAYRHTCAASAIDPVRTRLLMDDSFAVTADPERWRSALGGPSGSSGRSIPRIQFNSTVPVTCWSEPEPTLADNSESGPAGRCDTTRGGGSDESAGGFDTVVEICVAPVLVCSAVQQTAGAGDNISAGALSVQTTSRRPVTSAEQWK